MDIMFSSQQVALECCLAALGVDIYQTRVAMPTVAPPWAFSAVLRAGGIPGILDINERLEYFVQELKDCYEESGEMIVILYRPFGVRPSEEILEFLKDKIVIHITPSCIMESDLINSFTFSIYNMHNILNEIEGGILHCKYKDNEKTILEFKNGVLGCGDSISKLVVRKYLDNKTTYETCTNNLKVERLTDLLEFESKLNPIIPFKDCCNDLYPIWINDAEKAIVELHSSIYDLAQRSNVIKLLHTYPEIRARFKEVPEYISDQFVNKMIAVNYNKQIPTLLKGM